MELAGARREPCMLNDRSSAKVGLEPDGKQERTDPRMQGQETLPGNGIVTVRAGSTAGVEGWITCAPGHAATEWCHDPEPNHTDLLGHG